MVSTLISILLALSFLGMPLSSRAQESGDQVPVEQEEEKKEEAHDGVNWPAVVALRMRHEPLGMIYSLFHSENNDLDATFRYKYLRHHVLGYVKENGDDISDEDRKAVVGHLQRILKLSAEKEWMDEHVSSMLGVLSEELEGKNPQIEDFKVKGVKPAALAPDQQQLAARHPLLGQAFSVLSPANAGMNQTSRVRFLEEQLGKYLEATRIAEADRRAFAAFIAAKLAPAESEDRYDDYTRESLIALFEHLRINDEVVLAALAKSARRSEHADEDYFGIRAGALDMLAMMNPGDPRVGEIATDALADFRLGDTFAAAALIGKVSPLRFSRLPQKNQEALLEWLSTPAAKKSKDIDATEEGEFLDDEFRNNSVVDAKRSLLAYVGSHYGQGPALAKTVRESIATETEPSIRAQAALVLGMYGATGDAEFDDETERVLQALVDDDEENEDIRANASTALSLLKKNLRGEAGLKELGRIRKQERNQVLDRIKESVEDSEAKQDLDRALAPGS